MPSTSTILDLAPISCYLASNDLDKSNVFGNPVKDPLRPQKIYSVYIIAKKVFDLDPAYTGLDYVVSRLWELMGKYGLQAQSISGGGGSVAPVTPETAIIPYDFIVGSTSFIQTGGSSVTLPIEWQGLNIIFALNHVVQSQVNDGTSCYSWDSSSRLFTLINTVAYENDLIQIYPIL